MDRRRVDLQIRAILIPYRVERQRSDAATIEQFRLRARRMLDVIEKHVEADPAMRQQLADARREIDANEP